MRKISIWAKLHPAPARIIIVFIKMMLLGAAIFNGKLFYEQGITLSPIIAVFAILLLITAAFIYSEKKSFIHAKRKLYTRRKSCDFTLAFATYILVSVLSNNEQVFIDSASSHRVMAASFAKVNPPTAEEILASLKYRSKSSLTKEEKRILKKEFFRQVKIYAKSKVNGDKSGVKALLIILTIMGAIGLTLVLSALACSLSCSGSDGLAILLGVVGLTGIIWGTIVIIKRIKIHYNKKNSEAANKQTN